MPAVAHDEHEDDFFSMSAAQTAWQHLYVAAPIRWLRICSAKASEELRSKPSEDNVAQVRQGILILGIC